MHDNHHDSIWARSCWLHIHFDNLLVNQVTIVCVINNQNFATAHRHSRKSCLIDAIVANLWMLNFDALRLLIRDVTEQLVMSTDIVKVMVRCCVQLHVHVEASTGIRRPSSPLTSFHNKRLTT